MKRASMTVALLLAVAAGLFVIGASLVWGGPVRPPPLPGIAESFRSIPLDGLPSPSTYAGSDGTPLVYRAYRPNEEPKGSVTLVHGSSASGVSMHPLASALAAAGFLVFTLDMRGHGLSGVKGHIDHIGQLDDDLAAFVKAVQPPSPSTLAGFSSGGGFALRVAGGNRQELFGSYLLLSPFLSQAAPNQRPASGGWVSVGIPRIVALSVLNAVGISALNKLPVTAFALDDRARAILTPTYDFNLASNFRPRSDYSADIRSARAPRAVLAGSADEAFATRELAGIFRSDQDQGWTVQLLPGIGHASLILDATAIAAAVDVVRALQRRRARRCSFNSADREPDQPAATPDLHCTK